MKSRAIQIQHQFVWASLCVLAIGLYSNQYVTLTKLRDLVIAAGTSTHIEKVQAGALEILLDGWKGVLSWEDYAIAAALAGVVLALIGAELRSRRVSRMLADFENRPIAMLSLLVLIAAIVTRYYLNRGAVFMGDATMHIETSAMVAEHFRQLSLPVWSNYWYGGFPLLEFYAPLYFYLTGLMTLVLGDVHVATKIFLWLAHIGSMVTMFLFLNAAFARRGHALLGALCYGLAFHHMHIIMYRGDLHLALIYFVYPLLFLHLERYLSGRINIRQAFVTTAFTAALLIISHHAYAFFGLVFFAVHATIRIGCEVRGLVAKTRALMPIILALAGGAAMCAFLLVPAVFDREFVRGMPELPFAILIPALPDHRFLGAMLRWAVIGDRANIGYLGISVAIFALIGIVSGLRRANPTVLALAGAGLYAICTLRSGFQYNVKNMNFVVFYAAALSAFAPVAFDSWRSSPQGDNALRRARIVVLMITLAVIDLAPSTFQNVFRDDIEFKEQMYTRIRERDENYKVVERQLIYYEPGIDQRRAFDSNMLGIVTPSSPLPTPFGWVHEAAGKTFGFNAESIKQLHRELHKNQISERSLQSLMLMGVKFVTFRDRNHYYDPPLPSSTDFTIENGLLELRDARPLIAAPKLVAINNLEGFEQNNKIESGRYFDTDTFDYDNDNYAQLVAPLLDTMQLDRTRGIAAAIPVFEQDARATEAMAADLEVDILEFRLDIDSLFVRYHATSAAFAQLAFTYFPYLDARIDDQPITFSRTAMNYLLTELPAGEHTLTVHGRASPLRRTSFWFSLATILAVLVVPARTLKWLVGASTERARDIAGGNSEC